MWFTEYPPQISPSRQIRINLQYMISMYPSNGLATNYQRNIDYLKRMNKFQIDMRYIHNYTICVLLSCVSLSFKIGFPPWRQSLVYHFAPVDFKVQRKMKLIPLLFLVASTRGLVVEDGSSVMNFIEDKNDLLTGTFALLD